MIRPVLSTYSSYRLTPPAAGIRDEAYRRVARTSTTLPWVGGRRL
jgi:hypothetical protein